MGRNVVILCPGENLKTFYLFKNLVFSSPALSLSKTRSSANADKPAWCV